LYYHNLVKVFLIILLINSSKLIPSAFAALGSKLVLVSPGSVFISKQNGLKALSKLELIKP